MKAEAFFNQGRKFFFNDIPLTVRYVQEHCKDELQHVMRVADEVAAKTFKFDMSWDMEQTVEPVTFKGAINWLHQPGDDPEFIFAFNRMRFWICLGQAYAVTKDEKYAQAFAEQLCSWVATVPRTEENAKAWRTLETGLRLEYWTKAIMYFRDSPSITEEVIDTFIASMTDHAEFLMSVWNSYNLMSNWGVLANHGLFIAGVMLPETARTAEYRSTALERLAKELAIQVYPDGVQWEQSPMYHNEVTQNYLSVIILADRNNIPLPAGFRETVHRMCLVNTVWQKPDGHELAMGDSDDIDLRGINTTAAVVFRDGTLKSCGHEQLDYDSAWETGAESIPLYEALPAAAPAELTQQLAHSGNCYLRSSRKEDAVFFHFHCGTLGAGHGHSDQLHIDLCANGEDILVDAGRYTYVNKAERFEFKDAYAHNTVIADGKSCYAYKDSWECTSLDRAVDRVCRDTEQYAYAEGGHLGYMARSGIFANRRIVYIKPDIFIICDELYTAGSHCYDSMLHFNNAGALSGSGGAWTYTSSRNCTQIVLPVMSGTNTVKVPSKISRHYNSFEQNEALKTTWQAEGFSSHFTVICAGKAGDQERLTADFVPVTSNFKGITFSDSQIQALSIRKGERHYLVVIAHEEYASPTDTFCADTCTGFGSVTVFNRAAGENEIGTMLQV